ncbi:MAG: ATP-grasp domain-containing protein, partial [Chloroflexota bacterium]
AEELSDYWNVPLGLQFDEPDKAVQTIVEFAETTPIQAILAIDDSAALIAARASETLGLPHNSSEAALAARDKYVMRQYLGKADILLPEFRLYDMTDDPVTISDSITYPCVVKPLLLSGSRGVMRANNPSEFQAVFDRLGRMLTRMHRVDHSTKIMVEDYIPGVEVALEGMLDNGKLHVLALFDKPDPLEGPFFEETIYVTPSRLSDAVQADIARCTVRAAASLGLYHGPIHAELRINESGPWIVEIAGRSIGGLCSQTLRFGPDVSLEALILQQAVGLTLTSLNREAQASGVMMIPIPEAGILKGISGIEAAEAVSGIESVEITAKINYPLTPLPEGDSYLGFIFAKGTDPATVETALRQAHQQLEFAIEAMLPML